MKGQRRGRSASVVVCRISVKWVGDRSPFLPPVQGAVVVANRYTKYKDGEWGVAALLPCMMLAVNPVTFLHLCEKEATSWRHVAPNHNKNHLQALYIVRLRSYSIIWKPSQSLEQKLDDRAEENQNRRKSRTRLRAKCETHYFCKTNVCLNSHELLTLIKIYEHYH